MKFVFNINLIGGPNKIQLNSLSVNLARVLKCILEYSSILIE